MNLKKGGGEMIQIHDIYPCYFIKDLDLYSLEIESKFAPYKWVSARLLRKV